MYIALEDREKKGSTKLHLDLSDAINVLAYTVKSSTGVPGGALWHIFSREQTIRLATILKSHPSYGGSGNPIHNQTIYLSASDLDDLKRNHGIVPYEVIQLEGQAVTIPAGCAHQVCDLCFYIAHHR